MYGSAQTAAKIAMMTSNPKITARVFASITGSPWPCTGAFTNALDKIRLVHFGQEIDSLCQPAAD